MKASSLEERSETQLWFYCYHFTYLANSILQKLLQFGSVFCGLHYFTARQCWFSCHLQWHYSLISPLDPLFEFECSICFVLSHLQWHYSNSGLFLRPASFVPPWKLHWRWCFSYLLVLVDVVVALIWLRCIYSIGFKFCERQLPDYFLLNCCVVDESHFAWFFSLLSLLGG